MKDSKLGLTFWLNLHSPHVKTHASSTDLYLPPFSGQMKSTWFWSAPAIPVSTCRNTFNFFDYLVIFRHYVTGDGKVSCILATISNWFPNTKHESPAGKQFWKFSRQCSIFGRIGDQWVANSSPVTAVDVTGLKITASQRTMSSLIVDLMGQTLVLPVILTSHFWMRTFYNIFHIVVT